jgi:Ca2+-binding RTX toxin-like protein
VTQINSGEGNDTINLGNTEDQLSDILGALVIDGGGHSTTVTAGETAMLPAGDTLNINDQGYEPDAEYNLGGSTFNRDGNVAQITSYSAIETISLNTGSGVSDINVSGTPDASHITITSQDAADNIDVAATGIGSILIVSAAGGDDTVDIIATGDCSLTIVNGGSGADLLTVNSSGTDSAVILNGEAGNDEIYAPEVTIDLVIMGEGGNDIIFSGTGNDQISGGDGDDVIVAGPGADIVTGGSGSDLILGDSGLVDPAGPTTGPRFRTLIGDRIYGEDPNVDDGKVLIDRSKQYSNPDGSPVWAGSEITLLGYALTFDGSATDVSYDDYISGGPDDDTIFGQLGDDTIQGDGSIDPAEDGQFGPSIPIPGSGLYFNVYESDSDGDDYIEGNSGDGDASNGEDLIYGGLGQDDIIGGSSEHFGLDSPGERPDGSDIIFGGAGRDITRNTMGDESDEGHARDADVIAGDNANIYRLVGTGGVSTDAYLVFNYDNYSQTLRIIPRAVELIDYTPGGLDWDPAAINDNGAADEIHGEAGDDVLYGMLGADLLFGEGQDDDIIGGTGHDWISGGTGTDGVIGDDGRIYTSRNTAPDDKFDTDLSEPLYGIEKVKAEIISTPGDIQYAEINEPGKLKKTVNLRRLWGAADGRL